MNIKRIFIVVALVAATNLRANVAPRIVHAETDAAYSIVWGNRVARITDLMPEIKIDGRWVLASEFGGIKWDHHYGALEEGVRKDSSMTSLQAHNKAIREIRSVLPEDMVITRSMGYLLGALECYDAIRIGNDINHPGVKSPSEPWANMTYGKTLGTIDDDQVEKGLIRFARQAARNFFVHKNIAIVDPDAFFVSPQYTLDEAKCHMTLQAIMGGLFFTGDRVESLPEERLALLKNREIMAVNRLGEHAVLLDLFSGIDIPTIWKQATKDRLIITLFNWSDEACSRRYNFKKDFELQDDDYCLVELWSGEEMIAREGMLSLSMTPHSVKVIEFKK